MSDVHILLPFHVKAQQLACLMARLVGARCWQEGEIAVAWVPGPGAFVEVPYDGRKTCDSANPWHVVFQQAPQIQLGTTMTHGVDHGHLLFEDVLRQKHTWMFFPEYSESILEAKLVCANSNALNAAIAERVIDFFGGRALFDHQVPALETMKDASAARFPLRRPDMNEEERHCQFQQALWDAEPLTGAAIRKASDWATFGLTPGCELLAGALDAACDKKQLHLLLDDSLAGVAEGKRRGRL